MLEIKSMITLILQITLHQDKERNISAIINFLLGLAESQGVKQLTKIVAILENHKRSPIHKGESIP